MCQPYCNGAGPAAAAALLLLLLLPDAPSLPRLFMFCCCQCGCRCCGLVSGPADANMVGLPTAWPFGMQVFILAGTTFLLARQLFLAAANLTTNELLLRQK